MNSPPPTAHPSPTSPNTDEAHAAYANLPHDAFPCGREFLLKIGQISYGEGGERAATRVSKIEIGRGEIERKAEGPSSRARV
jgi:hypothetical protein